MTGPGRVYLVGAGPGDPELITVRGLRALRRAGVLVYDRLVGPGLLQETPASAERIFAGKAPGFAALSQRAIEDILIDRARRGRTVVRLKGGDPFLFGRGGEEVEALVRAGIPYEVIPGVSSALAAPAAAGIPVTHRGLAPSVTVVTGHEDPAKPDATVDWSVLGAAAAARQAAGGTLVVLMGLERLEAICARLIAGGLPPGTPAAAVASASLPGQRTVFAPLATLSREVRTAALHPPAVIVIGEVAGFPASLHLPGALAAAV